MGTQGPPLTSPNILHSDRERKAAHPQQRGGEVEMGDGAITSTSSSKATDILPMRNACTMSTTNESPAEQSILELRSAQTRYRDLMGTREYLIGRKSRLDWEIRFAPRHQKSENQIRELREEQTQVEERHKQTEKDKGPAQKQLEQRRAANNGNATVSSKDDPNEWGTHTPEPPESEDREDEDSEGDATE